MGFWSKKYFLATLEYKNQVTNDSEPKLFCHSNFSGNTITMVAK